MAQANISWPIDLAGVKCVALRINGTNYQALRRELDSLIEAVEHHPGFRAGRIWYGEVTCNYLVICADANGYDEIVRLAKSLERGQMNIAMPADKALAELAGGIPCREADYPPPLARFCKETARRLRFYAKRYVHEGLARALREVEEFCASKGVIV